MITGGRAGVEFGVLGPVQVHIDGRPVGLGGPRSQAVLAALLLEANRFVPIERIVETAWGEDAPVGARVQAQNRMSSLRRAFAAVGAGDAIDSRGAAYRLRVEVGQLDADSFDQQVAHARRDDTAAFARLTSALALWRGPALAGLDTPRITAAARRLDEAHLNARELLIDVGLRDDRHRELVGELSQLVAAHPWRERFVAQLMTALSAVGRRHDALTVYEQARARLADELGVDPGRDLRDLHGRILRDDVDPRPGTAPQMLRRAQPDFTGRTAELSTLDKLASDVDVVAITGPPGVGKTALVLHWAHRAGDRFPDGRLLVNLCGYGPDPPVRPIEALTVLLRALGLPPERIPPDLELASATLRSELAHRRVLLVFDNASSVEQVRPLLPAGPGCLVIVTSRDRMTGLTALDGARPLAVPPVPADDAVAMLARMLGAERIAAEPRAATDLAEECGHLPLALRITAALLADRVEQDLASFLAELRSRRLDVLDVPGAAVRTAFDGSYARLPPPAARMFRLLGLLPRRDVTVPAAAALAAVTAAEAGALLDRLAAAHLTEWVRPQRYAVHDLLREYARTLVVDREPAEERSAALTRWYDYHLALADAANRELFPTMLRLPGADGPPLPAGLSAMDWLDEERDTLVCAATVATANGLPRYAWVLADALRGFLWLRRATVDWFAVAEAGLAAATAARNPVARAACELSLGMAYVSAGRTADGVAHLVRARRYSRTAGWVEGEAGILGNLGAAYNDLGDLTRAASCFRRAVALNERLGRPAAGIHLGNLGLLQLRSGRLRTAHEMLTWAVRFDAENAGRHLLAVGQVCRLLKRYGEAGAALDRALAAAGDPALESLVLGELALLCVDDGRPEEAREHADRAVELADRIDDADIRAVALLARGTATGSGDRAVADLTAALALATGTGNHYVRVLTLLVLAGIHRRGGDERQARECAGTARDLSSLAGFRHLGRLAEISR